uniref:Uncharacterized protein n=1 Tax=Arundo donax TaxID=35708 RepID=A0A0A9GZS1_ARUDO
MNSKGRSSVRSTRWWCSSSTYLCTASSGRAG